MSRLAPQLVVIAKAPAAGRVKTRLTPPFTPQAAANLAAAALADTLETAARVPFARRVLALAGESGRIRVPPARAGRLTAVPAAGAAALPDLTWPPPGFEVTGQRGRGLDERIAAALADAHARLPVPVVLIGMDTPQVAQDVLQAAAHTLARGDADAVFGPARDGGFWLLGLARPRASLVLGVPMSQDSTGGRQLARLRQAGLRINMLPELVDVDTAADAYLVAKQARRSRFAAMLRRLSPAAGLSEDGVIDLARQARPGRRGEPSSEQDERAMPA